MWQYQLYAVFLFFLFLFNNTLCKKNKDVFLFYFSCKKKSSPNILEMKGSRGMKPLNWLRRGEPDRGVELSLLCKKGKTWGYELKEEKGHRGRTWKWAGPGEGTRRMMTTMIPQLPDQRPQHMCAACAAQTHPTASALYPLMKWF